MEMDESQLLSLPDDALLAVLAFLPSRELFSLRVLCRRLRDMCLHPDLWRRRALRDVEYLDGNDYEQEVGLLRAVLRLVPCIGRLAGCVEDFAFMVSMVPTTSCVIAELAFTIYENEALATKILHTVHSLGGLKTLDVYLNLDLSTACTEVLNTICSLQGLRELKICFGDSETLLLGPCLGLEVEPSLTKLRYFEMISSQRSGGGSDPFLISFLETHAATLEEVDLPGFIDEVVCSLLGKLPKLRSLACSPDPVALDFVRQSSQLRSVLFYTSELSSAALQALTESRSASLLEAVGVSSLGFDPDLMALAGCLPRFPVLRELSLKAAPTVDFLRALTPTSAPRLTKLSLRCDKKCLQAWLHDIPIQDLLQRNPRLHLQVWKSYGCSEEYACRSSTRCDCSFCEKEKSRGRRSWFSLHRRTADCPPGCLQVVQLPCSSALPADSSNQQ
ncbi:uncharacterized protein LOC117644950 [Thrips palmi]|uniref:Uncharacterized protein LOC117644950 n=1 Tax=Thrips palmi TaxID=161013 RepID=A0A6P8YU77_THRPL|nr:uncharacterized protein LOC117644950 [Thrips palmi]XP_034240659.1 uncharacterized protein LOC117644950 [Thrips palmi]XP_034240660.1 uncharacterized protein LOC117644950 [Thrips palmi]XP_034240661.1 uncharacterized protein LOC117644950 [Thrips palmi]XP_034240662.1 uncharacterized protein LOC117644950 [Thrips palmi]XP_034240664.1 uncharacterized protein LOC117644950 [Thrips palmi]XP_034240665.1 uncharacterized protein LOC117644950 [Thrips palmi]XP_034240666.1 uncharacterized protein LOC1176